MKIYKDILNLLLIVCCLTLISACGESDLDDDDDDDDQVTDPLVRSNIVDRELAVGDSFGIIVEMNNFPVSQGGGINLRFNSAVIRIDSVVIDPVWEFATRIGGIDNTSGEVSDIWFASFLGNSGTVTIASISATAVGAGTSTIEIVESSQNPFAGGGQPIDVLFRKNSVEVDDDNDNDDDD